ncbi:MAG TPA: OsmC family protein [Streptosporangiaceae bacterium]
MPRSRVNVRELQVPLRDQYTRDPGSAPVVLRAVSDGTDLSDPLHCSVHADGTSPRSFDSGAHPAVGGAGDVPCSGDLLLSSLAACQEVTLRMVAASMGIELEALEVTVEGDWDPRGTLAMGKEFPVGITGIRCHTKVVIAGDDRGARADRLLRSAERYCVVLSTLRDGVEVDSTFEVSQAGPGIARADSDFPNG